MNNKKIEFLELAKMVLESSIQPLSAREIWEKAKQLGYTDQLDSEGKTPLATLAAMLYRDIRDKKENSIFYKLGENPAKYQLKKNAKQDNVEHVKNDKKIKHYIIVLEEEMYDENTKEINKNLWIIKCGKCPKGTVQQRLKECQRWWARAWTYKEWDYKKDIEDFMHRLFEKYGTRLAPKGKVGDEQFKITKDNLEEVCEIVFGLIF